MKTRSQNTNHIVHCVGKQGKRPQRESNQHLVEKCTTGLATSLETKSDGKHAQGDLPVGPSRVILTKKMEKKQKTKMEQRQL